MLLLTKQDESIMSSSNKVHPLLIISCLIAALLIAKNMYHMGINPIGVTSIFSMLGLMGAYLRINTLVTILENNDVDVDQALKIERENFINGKG
jgi:hypothetical protein